MAHAGDSALTAVSDVLRTLRLHACVARLASLMLANPLVARRTCDSTTLGSRHQAAAGGAGRDNGGLAAAAKGSAGGGGGGSWADPGGAGSPVGLANGFLGQALGGGGSNGAAAGSGTGSCSALLWPLPLCATAALAEVGPAHAVLTVTPAAPPPTRKPEPGAAQATAAAPLPASAPVRLRVEWVSRYEGGGSMASSGGGGGSSGDGGGHAVAAEPSGRGLVRCRLTSKPALPAPLVEAMEAQLEAGCEAEFLDSLCLAAPQASALAGSLAPASLQAAGLLPGAVALAAPSGGGGDGGAGGGSALRLALRAQHAQRTLHLHLGFARGGYTLLRLLSGQGAPLAAWAEGAWGRACGLPGCHAAADGAALGTQAKQAWCAAGSLPGALAALLAGLGSEE